jgi:hypothetical protein
VREIVHKLAGWCGNHMGTAIKKVLGTGVVVEEAEVAKASVASLRSLETGVASAVEL